MSARGDTRLSQVGGLVEVQEFCDDLWGGQLDLAGTSDGSTGGLKRHHQAVTSLMTEHTSI